MDHDQQPTAGNSVKVRGRRSVVVTADINYVSRNWHRVDAQPVCLVLDVDIYVVMQSNVTVTTVRWCFSALRQLYSV